MCSNQLPIHQQRIQQLQTTYFENLKSIIQKMSIGTKCCEDLHCNTAEIVWVFNTQLSVVTNS